MTSPKIDWEAGTWTVKPRAVACEGNSLVVEATEGSDFWEKTLYGFEHRNGHALLAPWDRSTAIEVSFELSGFIGLYDQAGIFLRMSDRQWIKAGVEFNDDVPSLGAVVTNGMSDWSLAPVPDWAERLVTLRASRLTDGVVIRARVDGEAWRTIRVAPFGHDVVGAGPMLCAPTRAGFKVRFTRWVTAEPDTDLHADPPA